MPALKHTHTYERVGGRTTAKIWRCIHPDCTHTIKAELVRGKNSACPECQKFFPLTPECLQRKLPKCPFCRDTVEGRMLQNAASIMDYIFEQPSQGEGI